MSGKVGVIVQARMSSSRFPGKVLQPIGEHPLLFYVIERIKLLGLPVVVATSTDPSDDKICQYLKDHGYSFYRNSLQNVLSRYIETAEKFQIEEVIRITADNPLVDIQFIELSLPLLRDFDYIDGIYPGGLLKGVGFEMVKLAELKKIAPVKEEHREHVTLWLRENIGHSDKWIQLTPNPVNRYREDIFLTCDHQEDLLLLQQIFGHFKFRLDIRIEEVLEFLKDNPSLKEINRKFHIK